MPPGWYPDPSNPLQQRWWDGWRWTEHVQAAPPGTRTPGAGAARKGPVRPAVLWGSIAAFAVLVLIAAVVLVAVVGSRSSTGSSSSAAGSADVTTTTPAGAKRTTTTEDVGGPSADGGEMEQRAADAGIPVLNAEGTVTHTHTLVKVHVGEREVTIPASIGIDQQGGRISAVHTHDTSGIVHVESPKAADRYTVGQFLIEAGAGSTDDELCTFFVHGPCTVQITVDPPTAQDHAVFSNYGAMPATPPVPAAGLDTVLAQGAVIDVHLDAAA